MYWLRQNKKNIIILFLVIITAVPSIFPLFHKGFFVGDDGPWMIIRFSAFHQALSDFQFPVRFLGRLNFEYGYPVANFLYPAYMYLAEPIYILKVGLVNTIKIVFGLSMLGSAIFTYLWLSRLFKKHEAFLGTVVSLYAPYHLADMYIRGSLGELLAISVVPFILWQIERKSFIITSLGIGFLVLSHNTMAVMFLPIIFIYLLIRNGLKNLKKIILMYVIGAGVSAFFWLPALHELKFTVFSQTKISDWQYYFAAFHTIGQLPFIIFSISALILILNKFLSKKLFFKFGNNYTLYTLFTLIGLISIFLSDKASESLWHLLPVSFIQFPFRFLSVEVVAISFVSASFISVLNNRIIKGISIALILAAVLFYARPYFAQIKYYDYGDGFYSTNEGTTTTKDEYMPVWVRQKPSTRSKKKAEILTGSGDIKYITTNNKKIEFTTDLRTASTIQVSTIYWPGWVAFVDGKIVPIFYENLGGLMRVDVPAGKHAVELIFTETPTRLFSDFVSIVSLVLLFIIARKTNSAKNSKA